MINPGPILDNLVACHIFGYAHIPTFERLSSGSIRRVFPGSMPWSPSTDISAAWEVLCKIERDFSVQISTDGDEKFIWECYLENEDKDVFVRERANTAPHAICLAALKAVGVEV